jgi:hypothetical protein
MSHNRSKLFGTNTATQNNLTRLNFENSLSYDDLSQWRQELAKFPPSFDWDALREHYEKMPRIELLEVFGNKTIMIVPDEHGINNYFSFRERLLSDVTLGTQVVRRHTNCYDWRSFDVIKPTPSIYGLVCYKLFTSKCAPDDWQACFKSVKREKQWVRADEDWRNILEGKWITQGAQGIKEILRQRGFLCDPLVYEEEEMRQEMEAPGKAENQQNSTSIVQNTAPVSEMNESEVLSIDEIEQMSSEVTFTPKQLTDRWIRLDQFRWNSTGLGGSKTRVYELPKALGTTVASACESLVTSMWQINRTQKLGMEVRFLCPAQAMLCGKFLVKFYYEAFADRDIAYRYNQYSMSQGKSIGVRPGAKTAASLAIHWNNRNASLSNQTTIYDKEGVLNLGRLVLTEQNVLRSGPDTVPVVDVAVEIRFTQTEFHGRIPSTFLTTPVEGLRQEGLISEVVNSDEFAPVLGVVDDVEKMLNSVRKSQNEDKPPNPQNKVVVIPRFAESFSAGTGVSETLQPLRLDLCGKKPAVLKGKVNHLKQITSDYGLYKQLTWSTTQNTGTILTRFPVEPLHDAEYYDVISVGDTIGQAMPPVDIASSNFVFFSGNLQYKIEVINTAFHNGALVAAIIPLVDDLDVITVTLNQLNNVKRDVMELGQGLSEMEVQSDFHNLNHVMAIRSSDRYAEAPRRSMGQFILMVSNVLQVNQNASQTVEINIYKRGAADFELIELKTAILSPAYNAPVVPMLNDIWIPNDRQSDWYAGHFSAINIVGDVIALGNGILSSDHTKWTIRGQTLEQGGSIAQIVRNPITGDGTQHWFTLSAGLGFKNTTVASPGEYQFRRVIAIPWFATDGETANLTAFPLVERYRNASNNFVPVEPEYLVGLRAAVIQWLSNPVQSIAGTIFNNWLLRSTSETDYFGFGFQQPNSGVYLVNLGKYLIDPNNIEYDEMDQEMDNANLGATTSTKPMASVGNGMRIFGEEGGELMSILRRPVYRDTFTYNPSTEVGWPYAHATIDCPHLYTPNNFGNMVDYANRYTPQGVLQTAYLWVSGSLNRRIIGPEIPNTNMWINHKVYDKPNTTSFINLHTTNALPTPIFAQSLGTEFANLNLNSHLNVSIPWKQENVRNLLARRPLTLQDGSAIQAYDLGKMTLGFQNQVSGAEDRTYTFTIFDSWGDDTEISGYRGFPPMVFNAEIQDTIDETFMRQEGLMDSVREKFLPKEEIENMVDLASQKIAEAIETKADDALTVAKQQIAIIMEEVQNKYKTMNFSKLATILAGETLHLLVNPSMKTLIVSFINIIMQLGLYTLDLGQSIITEIGRLISPRQPEEDADQESDVEGDILGSILALLVTSITSYIGWNNTLVKNIDWKTKMAFALPGFVGGAWTFKRFMNQFFPMFKWLWERILELKIYICDEIEAGFLCSSKNMITEWVKEVQALDRNDKTNTSCEDRDRIVVAAAIADILEVKVMSKSNKYSWFKTYIEKIRKLHNKVISEGAVPYVRKEPFCTWWFGEAGVGKSFIVDSVISNVIQRAKINVPNEKTLIVTPTAKFLNRCSNQPEVRIDDFMAVTSSEIAATQLSYVFDMCTPAPYIPNQASVEKKDNLYAPKFLTICSNMAVPVNMPVATPEAFLRRINVRVQVIGNDALLIEKYGDEFTNLKQKSGFIYGELPEHMKEGNQHLLFKFVHVDKDYREIVLSTNGRACHTFIEMQEILWKKYLEHQKRSNSSYAERIRNHYNVRNMNVPPAVDILDKIDTSSLSLMVAKWLAVYEGANVRLQKLDTIAAELESDQHIPAHYRAIIRKYYHEDDINRQEMGKESRNEPSTSQGAQQQVEECVDENALRLVDFVSDFPTEHRNMISQHLTERMDELELYDCTIEMNDLCQNLHYYVMKNLCTCKHKMGDSLSRNVELMSSDRPCDKECWVTSEVKMQCLGFMALDLNGIELSRVSKIMDAIPRNLKAIFESAKTTVKDALQKLMRGIKIMGVSVYDFVTEHWKGLAAAVIGFTGIYYAFIKDSDENSYIAKFMPNGDIVTKVGKPFSGLTGSVRKFKNYFAPGVGQEMAYNPKIRVVPVVTAQGRLSQEGDCEQPLDDVVRLTRDAYLTLLCEMNDEWQRHNGATTFTIHAFCYGGRKTIMIRHEYEIMRRYATRVVAVMHTKNGNPFTVEINKDELDFKQFSHYGPGDKFIREGNFGIVEMPAQVPQRRSLIRRSDGAIKYSIFQSKDTINGGEGVLITPTKMDAGGCYVEKIFTPYAHSTIRQRTAATAHSLTGEKMTSPTIYGSNYTYPVSKYGYCLGALIDASSHKIIGFHYCGNGRVGFSEKVDVSMLEMDKYDYDVPILREPDQTFDAINAAVYPIGHTRDRHQQSEGTNITESYIHGAVKITTAPAILSPKDTRAWGSPLYMGVSKHGLPSRPFPQYWVDRAAEDFSNKIRTMRPLLKSEDGGIRPVTIQEAIFGLPGYYNSIDFSTSPGYGWKTNGRGKRDLVDPDTQTISEALKERINAMLVSFKNNTVPFIIAVDCLKDETLKLEKIKKPGSTRIISTMPFEYQIILRMITLPFMVAHQAQNLDYEHAIGISVIGPNSMEFDDLAKRLEGGKIIAGDYKNFGPGASAQVAKAALKIIVDWYKQHGMSQEFLDLVEIVLSVLVGTNHLCYDKVYATPCGIISGSGVTVVLNSLIHSLYMRIAAIGIGITMPEYNDGVEYWTYGDDGIGKVHDCLIERYNMLTISQFFADYNIIYTSVHKDDISQKYCELYETSFLKHAFKLHGDTYLAALEKDSIENQINWISKQGDPFENTLCNVNTALCQAYAHGAEYYEELRDKVTQAFIAKRRFVCLPRYEEMRIMKYHAKARQFLPQDLIEDIFEGKYGMSSSPLAEPSNIVQRAREAPIIMLGDNANQYSDVALAI